MISPVTIERLVAGGNGLGRLADGRVVFVPAVVPGDQVTVELTLSKKDLAKGVVTSVVTPGPDRVEPPCPRVAAGCGGCDWQHLAPSAQHSAKVAVVADALTRIGRIQDSAARIRFAGAVGDGASHHSAAPGSDGLLHGSDGLLHLGFNSDPSVHHSAAPGSDGLLHLGFNSDPSVHHSAAPGLRTTVRAAVNRSGRAGFYRGGTHEVVPSGPCMVAHPVIAHVLESGLFGPSEEVIIRVGVAGRQLVVGTADPGSVKLPAIPAGWTAEIVRTPASGGIGTVQEQVNGADLRVSISSFFQPGPDAASLLATTVADLFAPFGTADVFVDLYGGVGLFAATAGRGARELVLVESATSSVSDARHNLGPDALVHRSTVEEWDPPRVVRRSQNVHVVADPARAGLGREGVAAVTRARPSAFVLVSCDAPAGARDARLLIEAGYELKDAAVLDLFPHTSHMETVMLFVPTDARTSLESP